MSTTTHDNDDDDLYEGNTETSAAEQIITWATLILVACALHFFVYPAMKKPKVNGPLMQWQPYKGGPFCHVGRFYYNGQTWSCR